MVLPAELIDHIFSFLQKDSSALTACLKAHPLLLRIAERYIYEHMVFDPLAPEEFNLILENPRLLKYPRTLEIRGDFDDDPLPVAIPLAVMLVIPRMANLISLSIHNLNPIDQSEEFISALRECIQQSFFQELRLFHMYCLPCSVLDEAKNVKQLTLTDCEVEDGPIPSSPLSQLSLETLILSGYFSPEVHSWVTRWVTLLTTLELQDLVLGANWTAFPALLAACSNTLTRLHLDMGVRSYTNELPLSLSPLLRLEKLSISTGIIFKKWSLPEIVRVINTASTVQDVALRFHCHVSSVKFLGYLNWSLLDHLHSNSTGKRPCVDICVTAERFSGCKVRHEDILDALGASKALMDLVERGLVTLGSEHRY